MIYKADFHSGHRTNFDGCESKTITQKSKSFSDPHPMSLTEWWPEICPET
jgi:hypothetical protein